MSGLIQVTNPNDPNQSILIRICPVDVPGLFDIPDSQPINISGTLSIGRPIDR